jgi:hypothetical protein
MNTKTKAIALLSFMVIAAVAGSFIFATQSAKADTSAPVAADSEIKPSSVNATDDGPNGFNEFGNVPMMMGAEPRFGMGHRGLGRGFGGFGGIEISSDFTANVTSIANSDSDVQNLLNEGYNLTSIRPVISTTIDGNGNVVTKASSADLTLISTNGRALVAVDLAQAKVTKIVTITITEIEK